MAFHITSGTVYSLLKVLSYLVPTTAEHEVYYKVSFKV